MIATRSAPPERGLLASGCTALLLAYHRRISPLVPAACRFAPTCSAYAAEALLAHGFAKGTGLALRRVARCHPLCAGGLDPVPPVRAHG